MNSLTVTSLNPTVLLPKIGTLIPNRIFVGGITSTTTEDDLRNFFGSFGPIKDVKVIYDRSGLSKGNYGFVTFEHQETAEMIIKNEAESLMFKDRKINIGYAVRKQPIFQRQDGTGQLVFTNTSLPCQMSNGLSFIPFNGQPCHVNSSNSQTMCPQTIMLPQPSNSNAMYNTGTGCGNELNNSQTLSGGNNLNPNETQSKSNQQRIAISENSSTSAMVPGGSIIPSGTLLYTHSPVMIPNGTSSQSIEIIYPQNAICLGQNRPSPRYNADVNPIPITFLTDSNYHHDTRITNLSTQNVNSTQQAPIKDTSLMFSNQEHQYNSGDATARIRSSFIDSFMETSHRPPLFLQVPPPPQQSSCFNHPPKIELINKPSKPYRSSMDLSEIFNATYAQEMLHNSIQQRVRMAARQTSEPNEETTGSFQTQQTPQLAQCCNKPTDGNSPWYNRVMLSSLEENADEGVKIDGNIWNHPNREIKRSNLESTAFDFRAVATSETSEPQQQHNIGSLWSSTNSETQRMANEYYKHTTNAVELKKRDEFRFNLLNNRLSQRVSPNGNKSNYYQFSELNSQEKLSPNQCFESIPDLFTRTAWTQRTLFNSNPSANFPQMCSPLAGISNSNKSSINIMQSHPENFLRTVQSPNVRRPPSDEEKLAYLQHASSNNSSPINGATASGDTTRHNL